MSRTLLGVILASCALSALSGCASNETAGDTPALASASDARPEPSATTAEADDPAPPPREGAPVVDLDGVAHQPPPLLEGAPRLASRTMRTEVHARPDPSSTVIGYLRAGAVVAMDPAEQGRGGCPGGWRKIEPRGYVCLGAEATTDLDDPIVRASTRRPDVTQSLPYMYGVVTRGGPAYARIPTAADLTEHEPSLKKHLAKWRADKVSGAGYGLDVWLKWGPFDAPPALEALEQRVTDPELPWFLRDGGRVPNLSGLVKTKDAVKVDQVDRRNGVAFVDSFLHEGRRYNVSVDLRLIPADRFRPIRGSEFHGYRIGSDVRFPFALVRREGGKRWQWNAAKKKLVAAGDLPYRSAVELTGKQKFWNGVLHYETKEGDYVDDRHAGRVDPAKKMPAWGKNGEKWIDVNLTKQVLVAYEGETPVFATLVSSGEHGLEDPETTRSTKRGIFRIHSKHVSVTMDSETVGEEFELRDVPYVQYFEGGYALHGAYWHDRFGQPKSHGCINLAPEDARRLFYWTEPEVPAAWHGASRPLTGTVVFIHP
jgi:hypothetical protein